ncbi:MAG: hypothetical protein ACUVWB_05220 [Anaerolineae bacterium]
MKGTAGNARASVEQQARAAFEKALRRGERYAMRREWHGLPAELLPFTPVIHTLGLFHWRDGGRQDVPLDAIVGSVDRVGDFWRNFLPRQAHLRDRWCRVYAHILEHGYEPVSLFKVDGIYFVNDGNHRVSVLRALGTVSVEALVREYPCRVSLEPDIPLARVPCKAAQAQFLEQTDLDLSRPGVAMELSNATGYRILEEHIAGHAYWLEYTSGRPVSVFRAAASWYDLVYLPTVQLIRGKGLLRDFPNMYEGDLYIVVTRHHRELVRALGRPVPLEQVIEHLRVTAARPMWRRLWYRLTRRWALQLPQAPPEMTPVEAAARAGRRLWHFPTRVFDPENSDSAPASGPENTAEASQGGSHDSITQGH